MSGGPFSDGVVLLIFPKERLVVFALPKTGTTAIERCLTPRAPVALRQATFGKHMSFTEYRKHIAPYAESLIDGQYDYFSIMREPISWLNSWYRYRQRENIEKIEHSTKGMSFTSFVDACIDARPARYAIRKFQSDYICHPDGTVAVNRLFAYDDMDTATEFLEDRLGFPVSLARHNVSPSGDTKLSLEIECALRRDLARDFEIYEKLRSG